MARWICPFCNHPQIYTNENSAGSSGILDTGVNGRVLVPTVNVYRCLNDDCGAISLDVAIYKYDAQRINKRGQFLQSWNLWPESKSKPQSEYIPQALRTDYKEACLISDKSPKASATLARRCLQGMIRDFCGIAKGTLGGEIETLRKRVEEGIAPAGVSPESVEAIDAVRSIGSIGAHMEKDINIMIDVDPDEARVLIELIEILFEEWYVARHVRTERFAKVAQIAADKKLMIAQGKRETLPPPE